VNWVSKQRKKSDICFEQTRKINSLGKLFRMKKTAKFWINKHSQVSNSVGGSTGFIIRFRIVAEESVLCWVRKNWILSYRSSSAWNWQSNNAKIFISRFKQKNVVTWRNGMKYFNIVREKKVTTVIKLRQLFAIVLKCTARRHQFNTIIIIIIIIIIQFSIQFNTCLLVYRVNSQKANYRKSTQYKH
jgi:hypothetical protein